MTDELIPWLTRVSAPDWIWYAKYLAANDTSATGAHQVGLYIPKVVFGQLFPTAASSNAYNPSHYFEATLEPEGIQRRVRAVWYNGRASGSSTRNECRITRWGGRSSPLQDPESTGSLCILAFRLGNSRDAEECRVWLCRDIAEEEVALDHLGMVEPGAGLLVSPTGLQLVDVAVADQVDSCIVRGDQMPPAWKLSFPQPMELASFAIKKASASRRLPPDERLLRRRACEYQVFRSIEELHLLPKVRSGFQNVDEFVGYANAVTNRRRSRSGASLELQVRAILDEEGLPYSYDEVSELGKRPDFLFPSAANYQDARWPAVKLRMLAVKTTCKDRWRQVLEEAGRLEVKHLLTLQEGVSVTQFRQMTEAGLRLVVPTGLQGSFPTPIRANLQSFKQFMDETRAACLD